MATQQIDTDSEVGVTTLLGGIVEDARDLFVEQMTLFQVEIKNDLRRTVMAVAPIMAGACVIFAGLILLGIGAANLLVWAAPEIPLWVGYALIGGLFAIVGGGLLMWGKIMLDKVHALPETALKGLKENLQWKTKK
jgi:Putative Actinobacterial Holin-X, holin superfamily III